MGRCRGVSFAPCVPALYAWPLPFRRLVLQNGARYLHHARDVSRPTVPPDVRAGWCHLVPADRPAAALEQAWAQPGPAGPPPVLGRARDSPATAPHLHHWWWAG